MSTPGSEEDEEAALGKDPRRGRWTRRSRVEKVAFALVALAVGVVFVVALVMEGGGGGPDLQLLTPGGAVPGRSMAIRAFLFLPDRSAPGGIVSARAHVALELRDEGGDVVARGSLEPSGGALDAPSSVVLGMEGVLAIPADARGPHTLHARAPLDGGGIARCQAPIRVEPRPRTPEPRGRPMHALQQWTLFPVETTEGHLPPSALELRVPGGACAVGARCRLSIWVGEPAAAVRIEEAPALRDVSQPSPSELTSGIVVIEATVEGPEAELVLVASRDGVDVARRRVRLPILLGATPIDGAFGLLTAAEQPSFTAPAGASPLIVDAYRDGRWERTGSVVPPSGAGERVELPFEALDPGLWRVQIRRDPFGNDAASVRFAYLLSRGETHGAALARIRDHLSAEGADDAFTRGLPFTGIDPHLQAEHALSLLEMDVVPEPAAMSGRAQHDSSLDEDRVHVRWLAALVVLAVAIFIGGYILQRGLLAASEARDLLALAGDARAKTRRNVLAMTMTVLGVVAVVALSFVAVAILILARGT
jgi:hypothetical protein